MPGKGFKSEPLSHINQIRDNLRDRYHAGFPVIKELVQNADDAKASRMDIGCILGATDASHPLLTGPAFFAVNNGPFTRVNARALRQLGVSDKPQRKSAIGKFGLGMKSLFHLGEAFFYLSSAHSGVHEQDGQDWRADIVNPWSGDDDASSLHQDWDDFSQASREAVEQRLFPVLSGYDQWFCLWIPLRRREHIGDLGPVVHNYPGDATHPIAALFQPSLPQQLAEILPMLARLTSVRIWIPNPDQEAITLSAWVEISPEAQRRRFESVEQGMNPGVYGLEGTVGVTQGPNGEPIHVPFAGLECLLDDTALRELQRSSHWPGLSTYDNSGNPFYVGDKAQPHGAAYLTAYPGIQNGRLEVSQGVFLPIDSGPGDRDTVGMSGDRHFVLSLHGYYFVDAGRARIDFGGSVESPDNEREVQQAWNRRLARQGTLPLILPALERFVRIAGLDDKTVTDLTGALRKTTLWGRERQAITQESQWAYILDGTRGRWQAIDRDRSLLPLPDPSEPGCDPWEVFPRLESVSQAHAVTFKDWPRLTATDSFTSWPEPALLSLLDISVGSIFQSGSRLEYLARFLRSCAGASISSPEICQRLRDLAREAFMSVPLAELRKRVDLVREFLGHIPATRLFVLEGSSTALPDEGFQALAGLHLSVLVVPRDISPGDRADWTDRDDLNLEDAEQLLRCLDSRSDVWAGRGEDVRDKIALQVIGAVGDQRAVLLERARSLRLFKAHDCSRGADIALSWNELLAAQREGTLLRYSSPPNAKGLADILQAALSKTHVLLIAKHVADVVFGESRLPICDGAGCVHTLSGRPRLAPLEGRLNLIRALVQRLPPHQDQADSHTEELGLVKAIRYLIHARADHVDDIGPLVLDEDSDRDGAIVKATRHALALKGDEWRIVPASVAELLSPNQRSLLNLHTADPRALEQLLWEVGPEQFDGETLTDSERDALLLSLKSEELLKRLPIHKDMNDKLVTVTDDTYLSSDFPLDTALTNAVRIIKRRSDSDVAFVQRRLVQPWTPLAALSVALTQDRPHEFWRQIMNALRRIGGTESTTEDRRRLLRSTPWLPRRAGHPVAPQDVLHLEGLWEEVVRVVSASGSGFASIQDLDPPVLDHPAFPILQDELFPEENDVLTMLGGILAQDPANNLGPSDVDVESLEAILVAFNDAPQELVPSLQVLRAVSNVFGFELCLEFLVNELRGQISVDHLVCLLAYLSDTHISASTRRQRDAALNAFHHYLRSATYASFLDVLREIRLLNQAGQWRSALELCADYEGIDSEFVLDQQQRAVIAEFLPPPAELEVSLPASKHAAEGPDRRQDPEPVEPGHAARELEQYFASWANACREEVIGAFLALLGDDPDVKVLAESYLGKRSIEGVRDDLAWKPLEGIVGGAGEDVHEVMRQQRFVISIQDSERDSWVRVANLLGEPTQAKLSPSVENLVVGDLSRSLIRGRTNYLVLRRVDPRHYSSNSLSCLLRETARLILHKVYLQPVPNLDNGWKDLEVSEQLDIEIAKEMILDSTFFYARQLGLHTHPEVSRILRRWDSARYRAAELDHTADLGRGSSKQQSARDAVEQEIRKAKADIAWLLENDPAIQALFLEAIRRRMTQHYQYTPSSVVFELFQNADDSLIELAEIRETTGIRELVKQEFLVSWDSQKAVICHWGRPINQFRVGTTSFEDRGYGRDLEKMLILSATDKSVDDGMAVTGKFGLGFKSVFLVADRPAIVSDRLGFEVVGGVLPQKLTGEPFRAVEGVSNDLGVHDEKATVFVLPIREGGPAPEQMMKEFFDLAPILAAFAKKIKRIHIVRPGYPSDAISWVEQPVVSAGDIEVGAGPLGVGGDQFDGTTMAVVVRGPSGALLVGVGATGIRGLPNDVPSVWVTAPTREHWNLGFAVNAPFNLDVGRAQLSQDSEENLRVAQELGQQSGIGLTNLHRLSQTNWDSARRSLRLAETVTPLSFWESVWSVLAIRVARRIAGTGRTRETDLAQALLWSTPSVGMARLISQAHALPTNLWEDYRTLIRVSDIRYTVAGCLDNEDLFRQVCGWSAFRNKYAVGSIVSQERTSSVVRQFCRDLLPQVWMVDLRAVLSNEVGDAKYVSPAIAARLSRVVTRGLLDSLERGTAGEQRERQELGALIDGFTFLAKDGRRRQAKEMLAEVERPQGNPDEPRRARFAPDSHCLPHEYQDDGLSFFEICRGQLSAPVEMMGGWARTAEGGTKRRAALEYLLSGELRAQLLDHLRGNLSGCWLEDLANSPLLRQFSPQEQDRLLVWLGLRSLTPIERPYPPPGKPDPKRVLESVYEWWRQEGPVELRHYENRHFPRGSPATLSADLEIVRSDLEARQDWLELFILAATYTLGRSNPEQHRAFVGICRRRGWLRDFSDPRVDSERWMQIIRDYLDQQIEQVEFYQWLRLFVPIFQLSYWLDDYVGLFLGLSRRQGRLSLHQLLASRTDPANQGGGYQAPPLDRTLGVGACFVMRELARQGVLTSPAIHPLCYVPVRRLRRLMAHLGCPGMGDDESRLEQSGAIHAFLAEHLGPERTTFDMAFDIPLVTVADKLELQLRFLAEEVPELPGEEEWGGEL